MIKYCAPAVVLALLSYSAASAAQISLLASWVQLGPGAVNETRLAVSGESCPDLSVDGTVAKTQLRAAADTNFPVRLCIATLPKTAKQAAVLGRPLPLLDRPPKRIVVIGDTGCRIKGSAIQACNDPAKWPFPMIAREAARLNPDLVVHVGDYLYREEPCPAGDTVCAGSPSGDNWATWAADFFTPAAPLLAAAPWVIVRGNHEDCERAGHGWQRLLGPLSVSAETVCANHVAPYAVPLGGFSLVIMDDASAPDLYSDASVVPAYSEDFASLSKLAHEPEWLVLHRPIWGAVKGPLGITMGGNRTLIAALKAPAELNPVDLMLSGHIHAFEALNYDQGPPQIIAGNSGDNLDNVPEDLSGANLSGGRVKDGMSVPGFGFLLLTRESNGWAIDVYRRDGTRERWCQVMRRHVGCGKV